MTVVGLGLAATGSRSRIAEWVELALDPLVDPFPRWQWDAAGTSRRLTHFHLMVQPTGAVSVVGGSWPARTASRALSRYGTSAWDSS